MRNHRLTRLYTLNSLKINVPVELDDKQAHYLKNVLRQDIANQIAIFNGKDGEFLAEISILEKKTATVIPLELTKEQKIEPDIWLVFAPLKHSKSENIAQKATELGVSAIQPMITQHTIVDRVKDERLLLTAIEAAEQCERLTVPDIFKIKKFSDLINQWPDDRHIILCDESGGGKSAKKALENVETGGKYAVFIGPEGGFSKEELKKLYNMVNVTAIGLGPRILKADTAIIAALTVCQEHLGDWDQLPDFRSD